MKNIVISIQNSQKQRFWRNINGKAMRRVVRSQGSGVSEEREQDSSKGRVLIPVGLLHFAVSLALHRYVRNDVII